MAGRFGGCHADRTRSSSIVTVETSTWATKKGLAQMLKGGVIMDVVTAGPGEDRRGRGRRAVMALERVPADIRAAGGVARMGDPTSSRGSWTRSPSRSWPRCRIGHFVRGAGPGGAGRRLHRRVRGAHPGGRGQPHRQARLQGAVRVRVRDLGEALRRIGEGAAMIRTKGEAGTGNIVEAVRHMRAVIGGIRRLHVMRRRRAVWPRPRSWARRTTLVMEVARSGQAAGRQFRRRRHRHAGRRRPDDAARRGGRVRGLRDLQVGGSGPAARAIVQATTHYDDPRIIAEVSKGLGEPMRGIAMEAIPEGERLAARGW